MAKPKRRTGTPPDWALLLVKTVASANGRRTPKLHWYRSQNPYSSGHCTVDQTVIHVTAGTEMRDQQYVLLHELAHYLTVQRRRSGKRRTWHNRRFHERLMILLDTYGRDQEFIDYCVGRESEYMARAAAVMKPVS